MSYVDTDSARLFYRTDGDADAPALVLSNSLGTNLNMWQHQIPTLTQHFRVLRYDSRGHGASDVSPGPYTIERLGRDVLCLLDALRINKAHFCGLSMGGMVGIWLGSHAADRLEKLVLCNTAAQLGTPEIWNERIKLAQREGMAALVSGTLERWFTAPFLKDNPEDVDHVRQMLLTTPAQGYAACCAAVRDMDQRADLAAVSAPTLTIAGKYDAGTPPEALRFIAARISSAELVELEASHLSNVEDAERFTQAVLSFLLR